MYGEERAQRAVHMDDPPEASWLGAIGVYSLYLVSESLSAGSECELKGRAPNAQDPSIRDRPPAMETELPSALLQS